MTTKDSICISCKHLDCATGAVFISNGIRSLTSLCEYGGKNAGNRISCSKYEQASNNVIGERLEAITRREV